MTKRPLGNPKMTIAALAVACAWALPISAQAQMGFGSSHPSFSYAVTTGGIHIPTAEILDEDYIAVYRDNFINPRFGARTAQAETTAFGYRVLPWVEVSARLSDYTSISPRPGISDRSYGGFLDNLVLRDLSANFKVQAPRFFDWQPNFAIGVTDLGGAANFFDSKYGVMTHTWGPLRTTLGYGFGPQQFDGAFGGVELRPFDWLDLHWLNLSLLIENDARDSYAGIRYESPEIPWLKDSTVVATVSRAIDAKDERGQDFNHTDASIVLQIPLFDRGANGRLPQKIDGEVKYSKPYVAPNTPQRLRWLDKTENYAQGALQYEAATGTTAETAFAAAQEAKNSTNNLKPVDWNAIQSLLSKKLGFTSVRLGKLSRYDDTLVVTFENERYTRNEVDAFGIVLGVIASNAPSNVKTLVAISAKNGIWTTEVQVDRLRYQMFTAGEPDRLVQGTMRVNAASQLQSEQINWLTETSGKSIARITIEPTLINRVGTEVGNYDASVAANTKLTVPLWYGADLLISHNTRVYDTPNFKSDGFYGRTGDRIYEGFVNTALQQRYRIGDFYNATALGEFQQSQWYAQHETLRFFNQGNSALQVRGSYFEADDVNLNSSGLHAYQAGLLHYNEWLKAQAELIYHRYLSEDSGFEIAFRKYMGDFSVRLAVRDSEKARQAGFELEIPFSFRQAPEPIAGVQLNGNRVFRTRLFTKIGERDNFLVTDALQIPSYGYAMNETMFNRYRVSQDHFEASLGRMRDAFYKYGLPAMQEVTN